MINPLVILDFVPAKYKLAVVAAIIGAAGVWYMSSEYHSALAEVAIKEVEISNTKAALTKISVAHGELNEKYNQLEKDYALSVERFTKLQSDLNGEIAKHKQDIAVFEKEKGRFDDLFQKKAERVTRLANRATKRVWAEFEAAASENGLPETKN
jgi:hypothetical protein